MKRILFIEWKSFGNVFLKEAFEHLGYELEAFPLDHRAVDTRRDAEHTEKIVHTILNNQFSFVFSFNYFPIVAMACKACGVPYVSWTFDSPYVQLYSKTAEYDTNFIFIFDRAVCKDLEKKGIRTFYLPMAAPMDCYEKLLGDYSVGRKYQGDVSFVGSLYDEISGNLLNYLDKLHGSERGFVDALIQAQKRVYGYNFVEEILNENPDMMAAIQKSCPVYAHGDGIETAEWVFANYFINRKVTVEERKEILRLLARNHQVNLYTTSKTDIPGVSRHKNVDYYKEAPFVYAGSKINLNISLRSIQTGIPLRVFDIMGCGGFLISNYQEDFLEYFEPDEDFVFYYDYEDLADKVSYYLKNDTPRERIAQSGRRKVAAEHTYLQRVMKILETVKNI